MSEHQQEPGPCDECGSAFVAGASPMAGLCPECAHWLYGYPNCAHEMTGGRCRRCGWDGSVSRYVEGLKAAAGEKGSGP